MDRKAALGDEKKKCRHNEMPMHQNHLLETALKTIKNSIELKDVPSVPGIMTARTSQVVSSWQSTRNIATLLLHRSP